MDNYYYLGASLPKLEMGYPPEIGFTEFCVLLLENLTSSDIEKARVILRYYDIENLRNFWKNDSFDCHGSLTFKDLEEALITREGLPEYVFTFLEKRDSKELRLQYFQELLCLYFTKEREKASGFLYDFLRFEKEWRLVLLGFRAKKMGRDLNQELQFEEVADDLVAQIMAQKDAPSYEPPSEYEDLKTIFEAKKDPFSLNQALLQWRFLKIEQMAGVYPFSMDRILSYLARLIIVEKWLDLDKKKGSEIVNRVIAL